MKKKRSLLFSIGAMMAVCLLTGCSASSGGNADEETVPKETEPPEAEQEIIEFIQAPRFQRYEISEKLTRTADYLNEMAEEGRIRENSVVIHQDLEYVEYQENNGGTVVVDFRAHEEGTASFTAEELIRSFPAVKNPDEEADIVMMAGFFETEKANKEYYSALSDYFRTSDRMNGEIIPATLPNMRNSLMNRDMAIIACHGFLFDYYGDTASFLVALNDPADTVTRDDFENGYIIKLIERNGTVQYAMTPAFFSRYYGNGMLKDTIIHLSSCFGFGESLDDSYVLSDVLLHDCGAETVIGHDNSVYIIYDYDLLMKELEVLEKGGTVKEALAAAIDEYGDNDKDYLMERTTSYLDRTIIKGHIPAHTGIRGNENAKLFDLGEETEKPAVTEPETTEPVKDDGWIQAYESLLRSLPGRYRFSLVYLDEDDIPELVTAADNSHAAPVEIYTFLDGRAADLGPAGTTGEIYFAEKKNKIVSYSVYGGQSETKILKIIGGSLLEDSVFFSNEYGAPPEDVYFDINGTHVSADEYHAAYDREVSPDTLSCAGYDAGFENIPDGISLLRSDPEAVTIH